MLPFAIDKLMKQAAQFLQNELQKGTPVPIIGVLNALTALLVKEAGFPFLYLSGASLATGAFGLPDLGLLSPEILREEADRIITATQMPLFVDLDNGWDYPLIIERTVASLEKIGVFACQLEDQGAKKRCGHLEGKRLCTKEEMVERIEAAKTTESVLVVARTDALGLVSFDEVVERACAYQEAGADILFLEAVQTEEEIKKIKQHLKIPLMINLTEFGKTPLFTTDELTHVDLVIYPMTLARVMYREAKKALETLQEHKTQKPLLEKMLTREELYQLIDYSQKEERQWKQNREG